MNKAEVYQRRSAMFEYEGTTDAVLMTGLASEAGEVLAEWLKEERLDRPDRDRTEQMLDELSDVLWYITRIAERRGSSLEGLMGRNLMKLDARREGKK